MTTYQAWSVFAVTVNERTRNGTNRRNEHSQKWTNKHRQKRM